MNSTSFGRHKLNVQHGFVLMRVCPLGDLGPKYLFCGVKARA